MALIKLFKPGVAQPGQLTYLDLTTGMTGHYATAREHLELPGIESNAIIASGADLKLHVAKTDKVFDQINFRHASKLDSGGRFREISITDLEVAARDCILVKVDGEQPKYFKIFVRGTPYHERDGHPAFASEQSTLEIEELVSGRMIWPLTVIMSNNVLTVLNDEEQKRKLKNFHKELLFTLRPESHRIDILDGPTSGLRKAATPAAVFFDNPFPIAKVEFLTKRKRRIVRSPRWIESVEIDAAFSHGYIKSTYLIRLNDAGRPPNGSGIDLEYKFTVYLVDRALSIEDWDPEVVIDEQ